jgi:hypothetical protein
MYDYHTGFLINLSDLRETPISRDSRRVYGVQYRRKGIVTASLTASPYYIASNNCQVYYRVYYVNDSGIATDSPNESRILTKSVAPPHTVASLKSHLCNIEGVREKAQSCLFASLSDGKAMDEATQISLFGPSGPGLSALDPVALVVHSDKSVVVKQKNLLKDPKVRSTPSYGKLTDHA